MEGNKFWNRRSKHGRDKLFASPELMWEAACEYFKWADENPLIEYKPMNTPDGIEMQEIPKMRVYTLQALCLYMGVNTAYFRLFKNQQREGAEAYLKVISDIEDVIYNQKFEGASATLLSPSFIGKDIGLKERTDVTTNDKDITAPPLNTYTGNAPSLADNEKDVD